MQLCAAVCWDVLCISFLQHAQSQTGAGQSGKADDILNKDFHEIAPIFGSEIKGRDNFKTQIDGLFSVSCPLLLLLVPLRLEAFCVAVALIRPLQLWEDPVMTC